MKTSCAVHCLTLPRGLINSVYGLSVHGVVSGLAPKRGSGNPHSNNSLANPQPGCPWLGSPMPSACLPPCAHWLQLGPGGLAARGAAPLPRDVAVGAAEPSHLSLPPHPASLGEGVGQGGREGTLWPRDPWSCPSLPPPPCPLEEGAFSCTEGRSVQGALAPTLTRSHSVLRGKVRSRKRRSPHGVLS